MTAGSRPVRAELGRPLRLGVVGCGRAALEIHLPIVAALRGIEVVGIADPDPQALGRALALAPRAIAVGDPRALFDDPAVEAVAICTPVRSHVELALAALDAGKHLLIEQPLALTLADCDRLIARAAEAPRQVVALGFNSRFHRFAQRARVLVASRRLGPLELVRSGLTSRLVDPPAWRQRRAAGGGVLLEGAMPHYDLWRFVLGTEVEEIAARSRAGAWDDESAAIVARMSDGTLVSASFAERAAPDNRLELHGRAASLVVSLLRFDGCALTAADAAPGALTTRLRRAAVSVAGLPRALASWRLGGEWRRSFREQWRQFAAETRGVPGPFGVARGPGATLDDGRRALAVALAAGESAARGGAVRVPR